MFDSLDDQMKHDDAMETTPRQRMTKWAAVAAISLVLFGGLYAAIRMLV
ncbi:MAG: hypothetical protein M1541_10750 [Acidobacteria bacterium]|nr:hypothetical protein [Acidobacteriota bacterium]